MHTKNRFFRAAVVMLSAAVLISVTAACGNGSVVKPTKTSEASPSPTPKTVSEIFADGAKQALLDAVKKSERLSSAQLNILLNPGAQADETQSNYMKSSITLTDPTDQQNNLSLSFESSLDASTGDASVITNVTAGEETAKSGGIYFTGNTMLIRKSNADQPMIQHTLDPSVAASFKDSSALERFLRVLSNTAQAKMTDDQWGAAIDAYLQTVTASAQDANYVSEQQPVTLAGTTQDCTATTLTLSGESAVAAARGLVTLISLDSSFKSLFTPQYMINDDAYGVTGLDGTLAALDALTPDERAAMNVTFKTLSSDKSSAIFLSAATGQKSMSLLFKFFKDGYVRENNIVYMGLDGGGVRLTEQNLSAGGDNYTGQFVYEQTAPGGVIQEHTEVTTSSTITEANLTTQVQFIDSRAASGSMNAVDYTGNLTYTQQTTDAASSGQSTGTFTVVSDSDTTNLNMTMSLEQSKTAVPAAVPQFLPAAGVSTADQASLFSALGDSTNSDQFNLAPATTKTLVALLLVFF